MVRKLIIIKMLTHIWATSHPIRGTSTHLVASAVSDPFGFPSNPDNIFISEDSVSSWSYLPFRRHHPLKSSVIQGSRLHHKPEVPSNNHWDLRLHHATPPLARWRRVTTKHIRWTVTDNEEIPCMQSKQSNAHNHCRYKPAWRLCSYRNLVSSPSPSTVQYK